MSRFAALPLFASLALGCHGGGGSGGAAASTGGAADTAIVAGVTTDLRPGIDFDRLHVSLKAGGATVVERTLQGASLKVPAEFDADGLSGGEEVDFEVDAYLGTIADPIVWRAAKTKAVAGEKLLLVAPLDGRCVALPGSSAPTCTLPQTCVEGACQDDSVDSNSLPPYTSDWSETADACKPKDAGAPVVVVGEGQADYLPLMDGETDQVYTGPQGGHHVWVAIRQKNLKQVGTVTTVTGKIPDLGIDVEPFSVVFTFDPDEGGYCKLYGLRYQLDLSHDIQSMLGHELELHVEADDADGAKGEGDKTVVLSKDLE